MTNHETERLKQLCSFSVEELAAFINRLSIANDEVGKAVDLFLLRNDTKGLTKQIRNRIAGIKRSTSFIGYRHAGEMAEKLNAILEVIENDLLPSAPLEALRLLARFIETDGPVLNRADDSDGMIGDAYHRACRLFGSASTAAGQPQEAEELFMQLREGDAYGTRDVLYDEAKSILSQEALQRVIAQWKFRMQGEDFNTIGGIRIRLAQIAESIGDPELHEEATLAGRDKDAYPLLALDVAKVYLASGKPEVAMTKLPSEGACRHTYDRDAMLIEIHKAMGNKDAIAKIYWRQFEQSAHPLHAQSYLSIIPEEERGTALSRMREVVKNGSFSAFIRARFFAETDDTSTAAEIVERHGEALTNEFYGDLLDLVKLLEKDHPLAATILYRANLESILKQAKSKNYGYAARYAKKLVKLSVRIDNWKTVTPHEVYWKAIEETHKRKSAFWARLNGK
ncbi:MAG: hypothetical protein R6V45_07735 [Oceanipulchritudo sp.]